MLTVPNDSCYAYRLRSAWLQFSAAHMSDRRSVPHPGISRTTNWRRRRDIMSSLQRMLHVGSSAETQNILSQTGYNTVISSQQANASELPTTSGHCPLDVEQGCDTDARSSTDQSGAIVYLSNKRSYQFCGELSRDLRAVFEDTSITFRDMGKVLTLLNYYFPGIPRDPRTLFGTPRSVEKKQLNNGLYVHFGLKRHLLQLLETFVQPESVTHIQLNIDGVNLYKVSDNHAWPIQCRVCFPRVYPPFVVGVFCGKGKPKPLDGYLRDTIDELNALLLNCVLLPR
ncbi:hypothetical protein EG68_06663 [Paragonimus skrjabini miyazakii]|uniref:Uncharacterized protein n=1 Tax=Paragonimus skrjabini miyazakii TaxID=59628 RepID=A0A8S9YF48_9TREM|nr:hypothetical protein EG68_06663 [Paragonimus skrjabini miyazakii]